MPKKCLKQLQIECDIVNFSIRDAERLIEAVEKTTDKCAKFFRKMLITHNKCLTPSAQRLQEFPEHEEHLKQLNDKLQEDELNIQLVKGLDAKVIKSLVAQAAVSNCLLEDLLRVTRARVSDIKGQLAKHEVTVRFLEPTEFETIASDA